MKMEGQAIINVQVATGLNFVCSICKWLLIHLGTEGSDCGFFAIANAMGNYDTQLMRKYLTGCLKDKMMKHFNSLQRVEKEH